MGVFTQRACARLLLRRGVLRFLSALVCGQVMRQNGAKGRLEAIAAHVVGASAEVEALNKILLDDTMNKNLMEMEYAVRGELVIKAGQ